MQIIRMLLVAFMAAFFIASASAQNAGTVTNHAFAVGKGAGKQGFTSILCANAQVALGQTAADPICRTLSGDVTIDAAGVTAIGANKVTVGMLATLAADRLIGNPTGSTATPQAFTLVNCSNALTYSTTTHSFGCNVSAGTGTVTSVTCFGSAITSTGTCATAATKSDQQTGSSTTAVVTPSQQQQHDSAAKAIAYVTQSAGTYTLQAAGSYNVASITKNGTGDVTVTFTIGFSSSTYASVCAAVTSTGAYVGANPTSGTAALIDIRLGGGITRTDGGFNCAFYGRQ